MKIIWKLRSFVKPYRKSSLLALVLLAAVVVMDLAIPRLVQRIIDQGIAGNNLNIVIETTLIMLLISAVSMLFAILNNILSVRVGEGISRDLREALFLKIQSFSWGNLDRMNTGLLMVRLTSDATILQRLAQISLRIGTRAPLLMVGSFILMFRTNQRMALMMVPLIILTTLTLAIFITKMEPLFRAVQMRLDRLNTVLQENIAGVRVVKAFVRAEHEAKRFGQANQEFTDHSIEVMQFMSVMNPILSVFINLGICIVIWVGGLQVINGTLSVGGIVAFTNYLLTTLGPLFVMGMVSNILAAGSASAQRVAEILETDPEVKEHPNPESLPESGGLHVSFEKVAFRYDGDKDATVLSEISFTAHPGETLAILGATGSGKSTLVNLIPRFYDATSGRVMINGQDVRCIRQADLLANIGIVPQETVLFSGSVLENIRYGAPQASQESVIAAAQASQAHEFILALPHGYDTHIEQRGANLSGGQKQRIAIARALVTKPRIIILDDSTSSVDIDTENKIHSALRDWSQENTTIVVAQRISTVLNANRILVIDQGRIAAEGPHSELIHTSPIYQEIYASQLGDRNQLEGSVESAGEEFP